jgi:hypothetical protein
LFVALREVARWGRLHVPDQRQTPPKGGQTGYPHASSSPRRPTSPMNC